MTFQSPGSLRLVLIKLFFRNVPVMEREKICFQNESKSASTVQTGQTGQTARFEK